MDAVFRNGLYSCHHLTNGQTLSSSDQVDVRVLDDSKLPQSPQEQLLPPEVLESRVGDDLAIECWKPDVRETRWYRKYASMKGSSLEGGIKQYISL